MPISNTRPIASFASTLAATNEENAICSTFTCNQCVPPHDTNALFRSKCARSTTRRAFTVDRDCHCKAFRLQFYNSLRGSTSPPPPPCSSLRFISIRFSVGGTAVNRTQWSRVDATRTRTLNGRTQIIDKVHPFNAHAQCQVQEFRLCVLLRFASCLLVFRPLPVARCATVSSRFLCFILN